MCANASVVNTTETPLLIKSARFIGLLEFPEMSLRFWLTSRQSAARAFPRFLKNIFRRKFRHYATETKRVQGKEFRENAKVGKFLPIRVCFRGDFFDALCS